MKGFKTTILLFSIILIAMVGFAGEEQLTAPQILRKVDQVVNAPQDRSMTMKLILIDRMGNKKIREIVMLQKDGDRRMGKFISPAEQKGIGFLSLPDGVTYIYMPAYKKTQRIASHIKNTKFAGTDFTYEDMEAKRYSDNWIPELIGKEENQYILKLALKDGAQSDYSRLILWAREDNYYPSKIEHYDRGNNLCKVMLQDSIENINGYWISRVSEMKDLKTGHKTRMILLDVEFDTGLSDNLFTERYLSR